MIGFLRFALLPLALTLGCENFPGFGATDSGEDADCLPGVDPWDEDYCGTQTYVTAARMLAPYGWMGDFEVDILDDRNSEVVCEDVAECLFEPEEPETYELRIKGDLFLCVSQETDLTETDSAKTTDFTWEGEGQCGLAPEGEADGGWVVDTVIGDLNGLDQIWIQIDSSIAVVTADTFFYEDSDYLLEGWISADLSQVYFHWVGSTGENEMTLNLQ